LINGWLHKKLLKALARAYFFCYDIRWIKSRDWTSMTLLRIIIADDAFNVDFLIKIHSQSHSKHSIIVVDATKDIDNIVQLFKENKADSILISKKLFLEFFFNKRVPEINGKCRKLTERETEIIKLKVSGLRNKEIANILGITEDTLETHITHINQKTGSKTLRESISKIL
jgi:DNA-binding CsgD family transcriptional regulator